MLWSQPSKKLRNGLWLIRGQMGWIPSCMQTCISMANLVNFHRAHPCHSLMEYTCGYCCCCRSSPLSLRWANVDPPVELKADHTFLHLQGDCLSLQWLRTPLGQTNTSFLHPLDSHSLKWWLPWLIFWSKRVPAVHQSATRHYQGGTGESCGPHVLSQLQYVTKRWQPACGT